MILKATSIAGYILGTTEFEPFEYNEKRIK